MCFILLYFIILFISLLNIYFVSITCCHLSGKLENEKLENLETWKMCFGFLFVLVFYAYCGTTTWGKILTYCKLL